MPKLVSPLALPSMTTAQRNALSPSAGWVVWDSTLGRELYYDGSAWQQVAIFGDDTPAAGWITDTVTWTYITANYFSVPGDARSKFALGMPLSWNDGALKYGNIGAATVALNVLGFSGTTPLANCTTDVVANTIGKANHGFVANTRVVPTGLTGATTGITNGTTYYIVNPALNTFQLAATPGGTAIDLTGSNEGAVVTITPGNVTVVPIVVNTDYVIANAAITAPRYSYMPSPQGFPASFLLTPVLQQGVTTAITFTIAYSRIVINGSQVTWTLRVNITGAGTAGSDIQFPAPVANMSSQAINGGPGNYLVTGGVTQYKFTVQITAASILRFRRVDDATTGQNLGTSPSFATQNGDVLLFNASWPIA